MSKKEHELIWTCVLVIANFCIITTRADDDVDLYLVSRIKASQDKDGNIIIAKADTNGSIITIEGGPAYGGRVFNERGRRDDIPMEMSDKSLTRSVSTFHSDSGHFITLETY